MMYLISQNLLCLLAALLIGFAIGWWIWARGREVVAEAAAPAYRAPAPEPVSAPALVRQPVAAAPVYHPPVEPTLAPEPVAAPVAIAATIPEPTPEPEPANTLVGVGTAALAASPFLAAPDGTPDNLELIKGIGPKLNQLLHSLGVFYFRQIAGWSAEQVAVVDSHLGAFKGRIGRDEWLEQAALLARGDKAAFEAKYGSLGSEI